MNLPYSNSIARTQWSNLPGLTRGGMKLGELTTANRAAAVALMKVALSQGGATDLNGVMAADDYLGTFSGGGMMGPGSMGDGGMMGPGGMGDGGMMGPPGGTGDGGMGGVTLAYASSNYTIAIFGTPSEAGTWELMFGGHHMAYNITYLAGVGYPVPNHLGVEPKAAFTFDGGTFAPMADEGVAFFAPFHSLSTTDLATAHLTGSFADVLIGPAEYGTGSSTLAKQKFPMGANRTGVLVSTLATAQQTMVIDAISHWVNDYAPAISSPLLADYTSTAALADTYIAWGGSGGLDPDVDGTYLRIDGPACGSKCPARTEW